MTFLAPYLLAELHREVYVAILKSWVPHGQKAEFAQKAGISRIHLSYLFALDGLADELPTKRLPSLTAAKRIARALPAPPEIQSSLLENMTLAHHKRAAAYYQTRTYVAQNRITELLVALETAHRAATFGADIAHTAQMYRAVRDLAADFAGQVPPEKHPASFAQACMYLHDAQCVLDRADDALRYAKLANYVLGSSEPIGETGFSREDVDNLRINAIRGQAVAYHNLGLDRVVPHYCEQASETSAYKNAGDFWEPLVGRDLVNSLVLTPRFSSRETEYILNRLEDICEHKDDLFTLFLIRESSLRCQVQLGKWNKAHQTLEDILALIPQLPRWGALHQAQLFRTAASLAWGEGDLVTWHKHLRAFGVLAYQANLKHQWHEVQKKFGTALHPVIEDLRAEYHQDPPGLMMN